MTEYQISFNQDFTSLIVLSKNGFRIFSISAVDKVEEVFSKEDEHIRIVERFFNGSLVVLVTESKPNCLKMLHFKKKLDICHWVYRDNILCVRMNRCRLIVFLGDSIHIHAIRDMRLLHSIENLTLSEPSLCTLSLNSFLAFPLSSTSGELNIFNANKFKSALTIKAHETALSAMCFSPNGMLLATASERGTVIRVFSVQDGQRLQEFRRGMKRCVRIASLVFSTIGDFLCASSNTETVHIFKIDLRAMEMTKQNTLPSKAEMIETSSVEDVDATTAVESTGGWSKYLTKAVSTCIPSQVCDVFTQDRAFATALLSQPGLRHVCGLARVHKKMKLMVACEDGFLYIYDFNDSKGETCKLAQVHDLRSTLEGVIELNLNESSTKTSSNPVVTVETPPKQEDNSYAGILKGKQAGELSESAKYRSICDAIDSPVKIYDDLQFPPVAPVRE